MANELHEAARDKEQGYAKVKQLVATGAYEVNGLHSEYGTKPVEFAAQGGTLKTLRILIEEAGADLDASASSSNLLDWAMQNSDDVLRYVAEFQNNLVARFKDGTTDLHAAAAVGDLSAVTKSIDEDPQRIFVANNSGKTALYWAARGERNDVRDFITQHPAFLQCTREDKLAPYYRGLADKDYFRGECLLNTQTDDEAVVKFLNAAAMIENIKFKSNEDYILLAKSSSQAAKIYHERRNASEAINLIRKTIFYYHSLDANSEKYRQLQFKGLANAYKRIVQIDKHLWRGIDKAEAYEYEILYRKKLRPLTDANLTKLINCYFELGEYYNSQHKYDQAENCFNMMLHYAKEVDDSDALKNNLFVSGYYRMSSAQQASDDIPAAIQSLKEAIRYFENGRRSPAETYILAQYFEKLADLFNDENKIDAAIEQLKKAKHYCEQSEHENKPKLLSNIEEALLILVKKQALAHEAKLWGYECKKVDADGSCFFHAAADQINNLNDADLPPQREEDIRNKCVKHIKSNIDVYGPFLEVPVDEYLEEMRKPNAWTDHFMILAFSKIYNVTVFIINSTGLAPVIIKPANPTATVTFGYEVGFHYQSTIFRPDWVASKSQKDAIDLASKDTFEVSHCERIVLNPNPSDGRLKRKADENIYPMKEKIQRSIFSTAEEGKSKAPDSPKNTLSM